MTNVLVICDVLWALHYHLTVTLNHTVATGKSEAALYASYSHSEYIMIYQLIWHYFNTQFWG